MPTDRIAIVAHALYCHLAGTSRLVQLPEDRTGGVCRSSEPAARDIATYHRRPEDSDTIYCCSTRHAWNDYGPALADPHHRPLSARLHIDTSSFRPPPVTSTAIVTRTVWRSVLLLIETTRACADGIECQLARAASEGELNSSAPSGGTDDFTSNFSSPTFRQVRSWYRQRAGVRRDRPMSAEIPGLMSTLTEAGGTRRGR